MKLKGIGRLNLYVSKLVASRNKATFLRNISVDLFQSQLQIPNTTIISFSGEKQFADQLYSIASFYRNVGIPDKWIICSDGSHSKSSIDYFNKLPNVQLFNRSNDILPTVYKNETNPLIKKLFYYKNRTITNTTFFVDSDVLFYSIFKKYIPELMNNNWFLVDENFGYLDRSYIDKVNFEMYPCNSGFFVFNKSPNWEIVLNYLNDQKSSTEGIQHWSEQTAFHVLTRDHLNYFPLDPRCFVVGGKDSFKLSHAVNYNNIALRHFVGPVRHKMWQYPWKKVLGI